MSVGAGSLTSSSRICLPTFPRLFDPQSTFSHLDETLKHTPRPRALYLTLQRFSDNVLECPSNPQAPRIPWAGLVVVRDLRGGWMYSYGCFNVLVTLQIKSMVRNSRSGRKNTYPGLQTAQISPGAVQIAVRGRKRISHQPLKKAVAFIHYGLVRFLRMVGLSS